MAPNHELDCFVKRLDCSVVVKVKVTGKVKNSSECSSQRYLLNRWSFCNQTWYGDATSWTRVSCKKIDLLSSSSRSQWGLIWSNIWLFLTYLLNWWSFLHPTLVGWHIIISWRGVFLLSLFCCFCFVLFSFCSACCGSGFCWSFCVRPESSLKN